MRGDLVPSRSPERGRRFALPQEGVRWVLVERAGEVPRRGARRPSTGSG